MDVSIQVDYILLQKSLFKIVSFLVETPALSAPTPSPPVYLTNPPAAVKMCTSRDLTNPAAAVNICTSRDETLPAAEMKADEKHLYCSCLYVFVLCSTKCVICGKNQIYALFRLFQPLTTIVSNKKT